MSYNRGTRAPFNAYENLNQRDQYNQNHQEFPNHRSTLSRSSNEHGHGSSFRSREHIINFMDEARGQNSREPSDSRPEEGSFWDVFEKEGSSDRVESSSRVSLNLPQPVKSRSHHDEGIVIFSALK